jgi:hypothetical protein
MKQYNLSFTKEGDFWYIDLPNWPFSHGNLMMVAGADKLCQELSYDGIHTSVEVIISRKPLELPDYIHLNREEVGIIDGATYEVSGATSTRLCWICPVTLFVFGGYPRHIYLKRNEKDN